VRKTNHPLSRSVLSRKNARMAGITKEMTNFVHPWRPAMTAPVGQHTQGG